MVKKTIFKGISKGIDKIEIAKFTIRSGSGIKIVNKPKDIGKIIELLQQPFEKCEDFVDSPLRRSFRIELFRQEEMVLRIPVAGNFVMNVREDEWYWMTNSVLLGELTRQTRNIPLQKVQASFA